MQSINKLNENGPKTDPCGTPGKDVYSEEHSACDQRDMK